MLLTLSVALRSTPATEDYDAYGNPIPGAPVDVTVPAWYEPLSSREASDRQIQQTYGYVVYLRLDADVDGADAIVIDGDEYEVIGRPERQPGGFIVEGYQRMIVRRTTG